VNYLTGKKALAEGVMIPFVLAQPSRSPFSTVLSDVLEPARRKEEAFFAQRGISAERNGHGLDSPKMAVTFTHTSQTISTQTTIPTTDSDEKTIDQVDDNNID
jgi:hypothetical protein